MVGSYAPGVFSGRELLSTDVGTMDVAEPRQVEEAFARFKPDAVLHLGAATDVDRCEQDPDFAFRVNAIGTENVALACRKHGATLVYASTGAVFHGDKPTPYHEYDPTRPSNVYAASKLAGEDAVRALVERHYVVRAGWVFGGGARDKKFVGKLFALLASGARELKAVNDKFGTPTYARDFLSGIGRLLELERYGTYHMGNTGSCTRLEIAAEIARILGRSDVTIKPVSSAEFPLPAPRGASEAIENLKLRVLGLPPQRPWKDALADYVKSELVPARDAASA